MVANRTICIMYKVTLGYCIICIVNKTDDNEKKSAYHCHHCKINNIFCFYIYVNQCTVYAAIRNLSTSGQCRTKDYVNSIGKNWYIFILFLVILLSGRLTVCFGSKICRRFKPLYVGLRCETFTESFLH